MMYFRRYFLALLLISITLPTYAQFKKQDDLFQQGLDAFRVGEYQRALNHFHALQNTGYRSASLNYNIAVTYFKLGRLLEARVRFQALISEPSFQWLATYNIASIDKKHNHVEEAAIGFQNVVQQSDDEDLAFLAFQQLQSLSGTSPILTRSEQAGPWIGSIGVALGYDDNVIDPTNLDSSDTGGGYSETIASTTKKWGDWSIDSFAYLARYDGVDEYDIDLLNIGINRAFHLDGWRLSTGLEAERSAVGGDDYLSQWALEVSGQHTLAANLDKLTLRYKYSESRSLSDEFDAFAGDAHRVDIEYYKTLSSGFNWQLRYDLHIDNRADEQDLNTFNSYSAIRNGIRGRWVWRQGNWEYTASLGFRHSYYQDENILASGVNERRIDQRAQAKLLLSYQLPYQWNVDMELSYSDNESSLEEYTYHRGMVSTGLHWSF